MRQWRRILVSSALLALAAAAALSTVAVARATRTYAAPRPFASLPGCGGRQFPGWALTPSPNGSQYINQLNAIAAVSPSDVWAVGYADITGTGQNRTLVEHYDGRLWRIVSSPNPAAYADSLYGVAAVSASDIWAVGADMASSSAASQTLIEHWNGRAWQTVPSPSPGVGGSLVGVTALPANDVWATGGYRLSATGGSQTLVEHWNGTKWSVVTSGNTTDARNGLLAVAAVSSNDIWAVGDHATQNFTAIGTLAEHYDGSTWSVVPTVDTSMPPDDYFDGVAAISSTNVWAVGTAFTSTSPSSILIEHWDGKAWSNANVPTPGQLDALYAVAQVPGTSQLWAVGAWGPNSGNATRPLVEHFDGTAWHADTSLPLAASINGDVLNGVAVDGSVDVWAAGYWSGTSNAGTLIEHNGGPVSARPCP